MRKLYLILLLPVFWLTSCNSFLDVSADNELLQKEIFGDYKGVRMAVNGVYRTLSSTSLYGQNLTWGFASAIGHNYQSSSQYYLPYGLYEAASFDWENASAQSLTESIWSKGYNVIASCNDIIQQVIAKDTSFFGQGKMEKDMILGEMYGVRALVHFDLFRLFCPAPVTKHTGQAIPYVTKYPDLQPGYQNSPAFMDSVIMDMTRAQSLLAVVDTVFNRRQNTSIYSRVRSLDRGLVDSPDDFFLYRATRMNYFAANALLARVYMYKGDEEKAYENARIAYGFHLRWFRWTGNSNQGSVSNINFLYPKRYNELFLCFSNNDVVDNVENILKGYSSALRMKNMDVLFAGDMDDYRYTGFYNKTTLAYGAQRYATWLRLSGATFKEVLDQLPLLPVIRASEMYHIQIEYLLNKGRKGEAIELFNSLRTSRGAKTRLTSDMSPDDLRLKLMYDIIRETLTEGQTFFMFKRLNQDIFNGSDNIKMTPEKWVIPIPYSESAYQ